MATVSKINMTVTNLKIGVQSAESGILYAKWDAPHAWWASRYYFKYDVKWFYFTGTDTQFEGQTTSATGTRNDVYTYPSNATTVKVRVQPILTDKSNTNRKVYGEWSTDVSYAIADVPSAPSIPTVTIDGLKLTAELDNVDKWVTHVKFNIVKNDKSTVITTSRIGVSHSHVAYSYNVAAGGEYKVRCAGYNKKTGLSTPWSDYSTPVGTRPNAITKFDSLSSLAAGNGVYLDWNNVANAKTYEIQYTMLYGRFDSNTEEVKSMTVDATVVGHAEITGLEQGKRWYFRVRAINDYGESAWYPTAAQHKKGIGSIVLGTKPGAPTTWSSTTKATVGDPINLYWVHNTQDGSSQTYAQVELKYYSETGALINSTTKEVKNSTDPNKKDKTSVYSIDTGSSSLFAHGVVLKWRVKTRGITDKYGEWSTQRSIDIYAPPSLSFSLRDKNQSPIDTYLYSFPLYIKVDAGPDTQNAISCHISIVANNSYETLDAVGNTKVVNKGDLVYSKTYDITDNELLFYLSPESIDLENNANYTVNCTVAMDTGLSTSAQSEFTVAWTDMECFPYAEVDVDLSTCTAIITPKCMDMEGNELTNQKISVYRRNFDGTFTEIFSGMPSGANRSVTDPHPALDYARYRVIAVNNDTGAMNYSDIPPVDVQESSIIMQWDEAWSDFAVTDDPSVEPNYSGSMLKIPYNIDVSDSHDSDVELVKYIGREHPVSYYGTQRGETSTWNVSIPKDDVDTLYTIRRLAIWMGDVYVREPSGSGYWANVSISFNQRHCELTIPVTFNITRVEGGV